MQRDFTMHMRCIRIDTTVGNEILYNVQNDRFDSHNGMELRHNPLLLICIDLAFLNQRLYNMKV